MGRIYIHVNRIPVLCTIIIRYFQLEAVIACYKACEFMLRVTDNQGAVATDMVRVIVKENMAPVAYAGSDRQLVYPVDSLKLEGSGLDADGNITQYRWKMVNGPTPFMIHSPNAAHTRVNQLTVGTYEFELTVTDNHGATGRDTMQVEVKNIPESKAIIYPNPVQSILNLRIDANTYINNTTVVIYDASGKAVYREQFMRTQLTVIRQINVSNLQPGMYVLEVEADINKKVGLKFIRE